MATEGVSDDDLIAADWRVIAAERGLQARHRYEAAMRAEQREDGGLFADPATGRILVCGELENGMLVYFGDVDPTAALQRTGSSLDGFVRFIRYARAPDGGI